MTLIFALQGQANSIINMLFPAALIGIFYFFFIRPQMTKQKEQTAFSNNLQKGEEVVTASGIIGQISKIENDAITLQIDPKTFIRVVPAAISKEMTEQYKKSVKSAV